MLQIFGRSSLVSLSVVICICTFELQSESSAKMFQVSGYFYSFGFGASETANLHKFSAILVYTQYMVCYILYIRIHIGGDGK